jgi:hypothetical protein
MLGLYRAAMAVHVAAGFLGLAVYWVAAWANKGGPVHKRFGRLFVWSMYAVCASSFAAAFVVVARPELVHPGQAVAATYDNAAFLSFLGLLTLANVSGGMLYLDERSDLRRLDTPARKAILYATVAGGAALALRGLQSKALLLVAFGGLIGQLYPLQTLAFLRRMRTEPPDRRAWLRGHLGAMIASGIALHTAFLAGGAASRYFPWLTIRTGYLFWFLPGIVGSFLIPRVEARWAPLPKARS